MQVIILAAGVGKRLRPLTNDLPKPMVQVNGKPILEYTLSILPKNIDEIILVVGYHKERIIEHFGDNFNGIPIKYVEQEEPMGTAHALDVAEPFIRNEDFLFLHADDLYHEDDLDALVKLKAPVILTKEIDNPERFGVCLVDPDGYLTDMIEKPTNPPSNLVNIGVYLLNREIFNVPAVQSTNGEFYLAEKIGQWAKEQKIKVVTAKFWHPIGYPEDVEVAHSLVALPSEHRIN